MADTVRRAAAGDQVAWDAIVESFSGLLWTIARAARLGPADANEVVQSTWLRLLENLAEIREPERLGGWLGTTAKRECLRVIRRHGREYLTDDDGRFDREFEHGPTPEDAFLRDDRDRRIGDAFAKLSDRCRVLLYLVVVDAPPYTQVAEVLDMKVGSIGPTRARCLERLHRLLVAEGVIDVAGS